MDWPNMDANHQENTGLPQSPDVLHQMFGNDTTNQIGDWDPSQPYQTTRTDDVRLEAGQANPSQRGREPKLSEAERKANKRTIDEKHGAKKKQRMKDLEEDKLRLTSEVGKLSSENENLKGETKQLHRLADLKAHKQGLKEDIAKIKDYQDYSELLRDSERLKFLEAAMIRDENNESISKGPGTSGGCQTLSAFMRKLDTDEDQSNVDTFHFTDLVDGKHNYTSVGKHKIPDCLVPTALRIEKYHGDVCASSRFSPRIGGEIYIFFCATIKEMREMHLEDVTEKRILIWRDAIREALRANFKVGFAMEHLKKIARGYFGLNYKGDESLDLDVKMLKLIARLNSLKE